ncbi:DUF354 domain-containing protein [uncultured Desulfobacter sp.]|uniref:DUF354 domain-containing protein n=1 Tax=uncultured Desulfobacter sp. TaxID=240139 RepID=UPI002AA6097F|nr:DUF354 domain-containing protein [uncultured Desulfobacter sp.]
MDGSFLQLSDGVFFYKVIKYWCNVLIDLDIDSVISRNVPHFPGEYGLYIACQLLEKPFLMGDFMASLKRSWVISSIENKSFIIKGKLRNNNYKDSNHKIKILLSKLQSSYDDAIPDYFKRNKINSMESEKNYIALYFRIFISFLSSILCFKRETLLTSVINHNPISSGQSMPNSVNAFLIKLKARSLIQKNKRLYNKLCVKPEDGMKYIYFAPNYQPERTTLPDAGEFADILRILDFMSTILPKNWMIYYKEHPSIFNLPKRNLFWRGHMYRNNEFYDAIKEYNNVQIIPFEIDSFSLIDNAEATVTATGTVAFESAVRGVPSLVFGSVWFDAMEGIFRIRSKKDVENVLKKITTGYKPDIEKIEKYIMAAYECSSNAYPNLVKREISDGDIERYRTEIKKMMKDYVECLQHLHNEKHNSIQQNYN